MRQAVRSLSAVALLLFAVGCDKATPVAPEGTTLTLSANPARIGLNGTSTITIVGRKPNGSPLNPGTEVRLSTDRGSIDPIVSINDNGVATATLRGDGRAGTATVTAATGDASVTTTIQIGESQDTRPSLIVTASPNNVPVQGTSTITVIARNGDGSPVAAGQTVILTSTLGTINPSRPVTRADGTAVATLNAGNQSGTAEITAILGSSEAARTNVTVRDAATDINVQANPSAVNRAGGTVTLTAFVTNSQGQPLQGAPVTFESARGRLEDNDVEFTNSSGLATKVLNLRQEDLPNSVSSFQVTASTPSGTGSLLEDAATITVQ